MIWSCIIDYILIYYYKSVLLYKLLVECYGNFPVENEMKEQWVWPVHHVRGLADHWSKCVRDWTRCAQCKVYMYFVLLRRDKLINCLAFNYAN